VDGNYDSLRDFWLLKTDGTIADDGSADLHWEAVEKEKDGEKYYKTIWYADEGMSKEESLVALLGGKEQALELLLAKGISYPDGGTEQSIGELVLQNYLAENSVLSLGYSQFDIQDLTGKDWQAIYDSYAANKTFYENYTLRGVYRGDADVLKRENLGDTVTTDLEYYSLLYYPILENLEKKGISGVSDPLAYLVENTAAFSYPGWGKVQVHSSMTEGLQKAFDATVAAKAKIPANNGGLLLRFQDSSYKGKLVLSEHAVGMAIDFDADNNRMYSIGDYARNDKAFNDYLGSWNISLAETITGYDANIKLASAFSNYEDFLQGKRTSSIRNMVDLRALALTVDFPSKDIPAALDFASERFNYYQNLLKNVNSIPKLGFSMPKAFVENMRDYFEWGGDWPYSKDYMHFETR
jgi:hypothetical protein